MAFQATRPSFRFNPTLVRLRRRPALPSSRAPPEFQSHAGSIEAGSLEARAGSPKAGFNPTLVRLRLLRDPGEHEARRRFQSHAGSIEAGAVRFLRAGDEIVSIPRWFN